MMEYSTLGRTGLRVSRLSLGAMTFGAGSGIWGGIAGLDGDQATKLVAMAVERGVNLIDTADVYSQGRSEEVVGQVLNSQCKREAEIGPTKVAQIIDDGIKSEDSPYGYVLCGCCL